MVTISKVGILITYVGRNLFYICRPRTTTVKLLKQIDRGSSTQEFYDKYSSSWNARNSSGIVRYIDSR